MSNQSIDDQVWISEAEATVAYLSPADRLGRARAQMKESIGSGFSGSIFYLLFGLPCLALVCWIVYWLFRGLPLPLALLLLFIFGAPSLVIAWLVFNKVVKPWLSLRQSRKVAKEFLCSVTEAQVLPDGNRYTVTGAAVTDQEVRLLSRDNCLLVFRENKGADESLTEKRFSVYGGRFALSQGQDRIWIEDPALINASALGSCYADGWVVLAGDQISISGVLESNSKGERVFRGENLIINFPIAAYSGDSRVTSAQESNSARPELNSSSNIGPAIFFLSMSNKLPN